MTPFNSTPIVWIAYANDAEAQSIMERIRDFSDPRLIDPVDLSEPDFLLSVGNHQSSWLLIDEDFSPLKPLQTIGRKASEAHEFFRCMLVGGTNIEDWPQGSIQMDTNTLSTTY